MRPLLILALSISLGACAGTGGSSRGGEDPFRGMSQPSEGPEEASRGDRRVVLLQTDPRSAGPVTMVLVNRGNSLRGTKEGRVRLGMGNPQQGYKLLKESAMQALLESLEGNGLRTVATSFERGDEGYFDSRRVSDTRYRGILYVEDNGSRVKVLGFRPGGESDAAGQRSYAQFARLKALVLTWFNSTSSSEVPISGGAGPPGGL